MEICKNIIKIAKKDVVLESNIAIYDRILLIFQGFYMIKFIIKICDIYSRFCNFLYYKVIKSNDLVSKNIELRNIRYSHSFSMLELLFVLVILGILASLALPRISFSRTNALSVAIQSDIQTIISSVQEYAITNNFLPQNANPQWLISYLNLSPQRWIASGNALKIATNGVLDSSNDCLSIYFDNVNFLHINFNRSVNTNLCLAVFKNYNGNISVPLNINF